MIFPLVVTVVAFSFAGILLRQYLARHRPYQLVWSWSLMLGGLAALSFVLFLAADRSVLFFKLYYIAGGLLMAAYLGLGSLYLLAPRRMATVALAAVAILSVLGAILIVATRVDAEKLHSANIEAGQNLITGPAIPIIIVLNTFGAVTVIGGALYSAWRLFRRQGPAHLLWANVLIAAGTIFASLAGTLARVTGSGQWFWVLLVIGFVVLFAGFLLTTLRRAPLLSR
jgi:hypothetical protein